MSIAPFEALVDRLRAGDAEAAAEVFHRYVGQLVGLASGRLAGLLRAQADPEDVVQSVFRSFFTRQQQGQFELRCWDGLWDLLALITLRKCYSRATYLRAARRDVRRELSLQAAADAGLLDEALNRGPAPAEAAELAETVERLFLAFGERERPILTLSLQGYSVAEVSAQLGCSERKVYRVLERVRVELRRMQGENADAA